MSNLPRIEIVKRQALATFSKLAVGVTSRFEENLTNLKGIMNQLTSADVNLDISLLETIPRGIERICPPVTYIEILDDPRLTIGIFVLKPGARLPLHDHPLMYGILKVIHGTVQIQSYSILADLEHTNLSYDGNLQDSKSKELNDIALTQENLDKQVIVTARKELATKVNESNDVCFLSPVKCNLHEIHSLNGGAAFIDVLAPPYNTEIKGVGPRPCRYFREMEDIVSEDSEKLPLKRLLRIPCPTDFWSDSAPYLGPQ